MPFPRRSGRTHSITTISSTSSETRPTLGDVPLAPRRRLRNGSFSTTASSRSRGSSRSATSARGAGGGRMPTRTLTRPPVPQLEDLFAFDSDAEYAEAAENEDPDDDDFVFREESLTPPPPERLRMNSARRRAPTTPSTVTRPAPPAPQLGLLEQIDALYPSVAVSAPSPPRPAPVAAEMPFDLSRTPSEDGPTASGSSRSSEGEAPRRFTKQEKGKGRAVVTPVPVDQAVEDDAAVDELDDESPGTESIQLIGIKRKAVEIDDESELTDLEDSKEDAEEKTDAHGDLEKLSAYTCPVCFSEPTNAVMTMCGHIFCSACLSSSLLAAIGRDPNVAHHRPPARPPANRGRNRGARNQARGAPPLRTAQPTEWSLESLRTGYEEHREREFESKMHSIGLAQEAWDLARDEQGMSAEVKVQSVLKGLWKVDGGWVIEGECPVCRKGIPGGYASPTLGIGGVIALIPRRLEVVR